MKTTFTALQALLDPVRIRAGLTLWWPRKEHLITVDRRQVSRFKTACAYPEKVFIYFDSLETGKQVSLHQLIEVELYVRVELYQLYDEETVKPSLAMLLSNGTSTPGQATHHGDVPSSHPNVQA